MPPRDPKIDFSDKECAPRFVRTQVRIANYFDVSLKTVQTWVTSLDDFPKQNGEGFYDLWEISRYWHKKHVAFKQSSQDRQSATSPLKKMQAEKLSIEAERARFKLDQEMGQLIHRDDLRSAAADWISHLKSQLDRLKTSVLRVVDDERKAIVQKQLDEIIGGVTSRIVNGYVGEHSVNDVLSEPAAATSDVSNPAEEAKGEPKKKTAKLKAKKKSSRKKKASS